MFEFTEYQILSLIILFTFLYIGNIICLYDLRDEIIFNTTNYFTSYLLKYAILSEIHAIIIGLLISNFNWLIVSLFFLGAFAINVLIIAPSIITFLKMRNNIRAYKKYKLNQFYKSKYEKISSLKNSENLNINIGDESNA